MEKITIEQCLNQTSCGEKLLAIIVDELKRMSDDYNNGESKKLKELYKVGNKLLTYNYYKKADAIEKKLKINGPELLSDVISENDDVKQLLDARKDALNEKKTDYISFFNGLMEHIEEWC